MFTLLDHPVLMEHFQHFVIKSLCLRKWAILRGVVIHGSSDQLVKKYSGTLLYQYDITKFLGSWHFRFGRKKIYKFSAKYPLKTINTFLVSVKRHAKVIPMNGKRILNSPVGGT